MGQGKRAFVILTNNDYETLVNYCYPKHIDVDSHYEFSEGKFCLALSTYSTINKNFNKRSANLIVGILGLMARCEQHQFGNKIIIYFPSISFDFYPKKGY
jgi:hypothetical protein